LPSFDAVSKEKSFVSLTRADTFDDAVVCRRGGSIKNEALPPEILVRIFAHLDVISLGRASQVCRSWSLVPWEEADFGASRNRVMWRRRKFVKPVSGLAKFHTQSIAPASFLAFTTGGMRMTCVRAQLRLCRGVVA
jgi:hypothetical protein